MVQTKMVQTKWWCWPDGTGTINQWTIETGPTSRFGSSKQKLISDIVATLIYITPKFQSSAIVTNRHKKIRKDTDTKRYKKTRKDTKRYDFAQPLFWDFLTISYHSCDSNSQKWQFLRDHGGPDPPPLKKFWGGPEIFFWRKKSRSSQRKGCDRFDTVGSNPLRKQWWLNQGPRKELFNDTLLSLHQNHKLLKHQI